MKKSLNLILVTAILLCSTTLSGCVQYSENSSTSSKTADSTTKVTTQASSNSSKKSKYKDDKYLGDGAFRTKTIRCGLHESEEELDMNLGDTIEFHNSARPVSADYAYIWDVDEGSDLIKWDKKGATCEVKAVKPGRAIIKANLVESATAMHGTLPYEPCSIIINISNVPGDPDSDN